MWWHVNSGTSHPESHNEFFKEFANDCEKLNRKGVLKSKNKIRKNVEGRLFCCDTPAKSFVTGTKHHNATSACHKCHQTGGYFKHKIVLSKIICELRTEESFNERKDFLRHNDN